MKFLILILGFCLAISFKLNINRSKLSFERKGLLNSEFNNNRVVSGFESEFESDDMDADSVEEGNSANEAIKKGRLFGKLGNALDKAASTVGKGITNTAKSVGNGIVDTAKAIDKGVTTAANTVGNGVKSAVNTVDKAIDKNIVNPVVNTAKEIGKDINNNIIKPIDKAFDKVGDGINKNIIKPIDKAIDNVGHDINKNLINPISNGVNQFVNSIGNNQNPQYHTGLLPSNNNFPSFNHNQNNNNGYHTGLLPNPNQHHTGLLPNPNQHQTGLIPTPNNNDKNSKFSKLFDNTDKKKTCSSKSENKAKEDEKKSGTENSNLPFAKPHSTKEYGTGNIAYMFDYLDSCLKDEIVKAFDKVYNEARSIPSNPVTDIYSLQNQIKVLKGMGHSNIISDAELNSGNNELFSKLLSKLNPKFNINSYNVGINIEQITNIMSQWGWVNSTPTYGENPIKELFDRYDWNGNGRLDPREFIFFSIIENKGIFEKTSQKNHYKDVIETILEPIFSFADCNDEGKVTSEQLWKTFEKLKCKSRFDIFSCTLKGSDQSYRTSSVNDLIIKNSKEFEGYLNKNEFIKGILLGFWDRQTTSTEILKGDEKAKKNERWTNNGEKDKECEEIKKVHEAITK